MVIPLPGPLPPGASDALRADFTVPGVNAATQVRSETVLVNGNEREITGLDAATITHFYSFDWTTGSDRTLGQLGADGAIVTKAYAEDNHLSEGTKLAVTTPAGRHAQLTVRGTYDPPAAEPLLGD